MLKQLPLANVPSNLHISVRDIETKRRKYTSTQSVGQKFERIQYVSK